MSTDNFSNDNFNNNDAGQNFNESENEFNNWENQNYLEPNSFNQNELQNFAPISEESYFDSSQNNFDSQFTGEAQNNGSYNDANNTQQIEEQIAELFDDEFFFEENTQEVDVASNNELVMPQNEQLFPMSDFDNQNQAFMQESVNVMGDNVQNNNFEEELYKQDLNNFQQDDNNFNYENNVDDANVVHDSFFANEQQFDNEQELAFDIAVPEQNLEQVQEVEQEQEEYFNEYTPERKFKPLFTQPIPSALDEIRSGAVKPASPISAIAATEKPLVLTAAEAQEREKAERAAAIKAAKEAALESERLRIQAEKEQFQNNLAESYANELDFKFQYPIESDLNVETNEYTDENTFDNYNYQTDENVVEPLNYTQQQEQTEQEPTFEMYDVQKDENNYSGEYSDTLNENYDINNNVEGFEGVNEGAFNFDTQDLNEMNFANTGEQLFDNNIFAQEEPAYSENFENEQNAQESYDFGEQNSSEFMPAGDLFANEQNEQESYDFSEQNSSEFMPAGDLFANEQNEQESYDFSEQSSSEFMPAGDLFANEQNEQESYDFSEQNSSEFMPANDLFANEQDAQESYDFSEQNSSEFMPANDLFANEQDAQESYDFGEQNSTDYSSDGGFFPSEQNYGYDESDNVEFNNNESEYAQDDVIDDENVRKFNPQEWDSTLNDEEDYIVKPKKSNSLLYIVIIVIALAIIGVAIYFISTSLAPNEQESSIIVPSEATSVTSEPESEIVEPEPVVTIPVDEWYMQLVNRQNALSADFTVTTTDVGGQPVDSRIAEDLQRLIDDANTAGIELYVRSGYRTYERQQTNYDYQVSVQIQNGLAQADAEAAAAQITAPPGTSEHNLGLGVDLFAVGNDDYDTAVFEQSDASKWLMENAVNYGFILRYPADKEAVTGFAYEPWHYRYVGVEQASLIKASGLTLEEYIASANS